VPKLLERHSSPELCNDGKGHEAQEQMQPTNYGALAVRIQAALRREADMEEQHIHDVPERDDV